MKGISTPKVFHFSKKSSQNCFNQGNLVGIAKCLYFSGVIPVPMRVLQTQEENKLIPAIRWKDYNPSIKELKKDFSRQGIAGIAIKTGEVSNLLVIDVDDPQKFDEFYGIERLKKEAPYAVATKDTGHYHFGFLYDPDFPKSTSFLQEAGFELKSNGALATFYSTVADCWYNPLKLEPLTPLPKELKQRLKELYEQKEFKGQSNGQTEHVFYKVQRPVDIQSIIEIVSEVYHKGRRQDWVIFVAALLEKLSFSHEEIKEALVNFLKARNDEEIEMRLAGIEYTFEQPIENVKGITGLVDDLKLSKRAYAKLKALITPKEESSKEESVKEKSAKEEKETEEEKPSWTLEEPVKEPVEEEEEEDEEEEEEIENEVDFEKNAIEQQLQGRKEHEIDTVEKELFELLRETASKNKKAKLSVVLTFAFLRKFKFWMSEHEEAYISFNDYKHMKIESKTFKDYLQNLAIECFFKTLSREAAEEVVSFLRHHARGEKHKVFSRVGYSYEDNFIEVNLIRDDYKVLRITKEGINLDYPRLKFATSKHQLQINHFDAEALKTIQNKNYTADELLNLFSKVFNIQTKEELALLTAYMLKTFYEKAEYPILAVLGEREGVGKTTFSKFINLLLDPTTTPIKTFPKNRDDLFVIAKENFLLIFDNLSYIDADMSDALCQLSTGGSLSKRKLYTDYEVIDIPLKRPIILNSIFNIVQKRDLRRRCIVLELKKPNRVKPLEEIEEEFKRVAPYIYGYLLLCLQEALKEKMIDTELLDLADFCKFVAKAHPVFFMAPQEFTKTLKKNREDVAVEILESNPLVHIINEKTSMGLWETTASELLKLLKEKYPNEKHLPTPNQISRELKKIASDLEAFNIRAEFVKTKYKKLIIFKKETPQTETNTADNPTTDPDDIDLDNLPF